jgi:SAM-dependent methyltransferase
MNNQKEIWNNIAQEWSIFREKPINEVIQFLKTKKGKILDIGCGTGRNLTKIKEGKMYLVDFSEKMICIAKQKAAKNKISAEFSNTEMNCLAFENNFFNSAIAIDSLHCIQKEQDRRDTIKELFRVLKPKAEILVSLWNKDCKRFKNSPKEKNIKWRNLGERFYYLYSPKEAKEEFAKAGFIIKKDLSKDMKIMFIAQKEK